MVPGPLVAPSSVPEWLRPLVDVSMELSSAMLTRVPSPPPGIGRPAAVLMLFGEDALGPGTGPDVLLLRRSDGLPSHPGQVAFPGGALDEDDDGPVATALRESTEEVGLDPAGVRPIALWPELFIPPSQFKVTPVLAHWLRPSAVAPVDPAETAAVARVPLRDLADPANRFSVRHPSGWVGPAFGLPDMLVWGFTGGLLAALLELGGWTRPWDPSDVRDLDEAWRQVEQTRPEVG
ncbi:MAG TPA: CoA pyrophosphatase [Pseudonocardiaceae bacterium]|nr:CoA pyrophosphatase [Pseudonocardiaceae bacterium]